MGSVFPLGVELGFHAMTGARLLVRRLGERLAAHMLPPLSVHFCCRGTPTPQWIHTAPHVKQSIDSAHEAYPFLCLQSAIVQEDNVQQTYCT